MNYYSPTLPIQKRNGQQAKSEDDKVDSFADYLQNILTPYDDIVDSNPRINSPRMFTVF